MSVTLRTLDSVLSFSQVKNLPCRSFTCPKFVFASSLKCAGNLLPSTVQHIAQSIALGNKSLGERENLRRGSSQTRSRELAISNAIGLILWATPPVFSMPTRDFSCFDENLDGRQVGRQPAHISKSCAQPSTASGILCKGCYLSNALRLYLFRISSHEGSRANCSVAGRHKIICVKFTHSSHPADGYAIRFGLSQARQRLVYQQSKQRYHAGRSIFSSARVQEVCAAVRASALR